MKAGAEQLAMAMQPIHVFLVRHVMETFVSRSDSLRRISVEHGWCEPLD
jgi:hypothetical protein